jgi:hypothetical protein
MARDQSLSFSRTNLATRGPWSDVAVRVLVLHTQDVSNARRPSATPKVQPQLRRTRSFSNRVYEASDAL